MKMALLCGVLLVSMTGCIGEIVDESDDDGYRSVTPPKHPGPGPCSGEECNGRMPYSTQCKEDDEKIETVSFPGGRVDLHQSRACGTVWARVWRKSLSPTEAWVEARSGLSGGFVLHQGGGWTSSMMYAPNEVARACAKPLKCKRDGCGAEIGHTYCSDYR